jgi:glycosyltransferase involved in cell wall biosynthesis
MKVLMFGWEFPPHISGGLGTACFGLTRGLAKTNTDIIFVVPKAWGDEDNNDVRLVNASDEVILFKDTFYHDFWKRMTYLEVGVRLIPYLSPEEYERLTDLTEHDRTDIEDSVFASSFKFSGTYGKDLMQEVARYAVVAAKLAREQQFDVIHAHDWMTYPAGIAAKEVSGKPLVVHVHATEFDRSGEHVNQQVYDMEREGMLAADRVICVSNLTRDIVINRYGIDPNKVVTVHNGVMPRPNDANAYARNLPEKIVTFLGRITFQKGPDYFVEAANKVMKRDPLARFVMAGSGDMLHKMIRRVAQLRISDRFHFAGFLREAEVDRMFAISDVYVMPSVSEPFGISPLEAMRSNVPVIISKQSGVAEVLHHAVKIDFWDIDAMADAIYALLHYKGISQMFAQMGKHEVESLQWDHAAEKVKAVYESLM